MAGTALAASAALVAAGLVPLAPAAAARAATPTPVPVRSAPDLGSAQEAARQQKSPVQIDAMTSATDQSWANPDGSISTESSLGVARTRQPDGSWADVDLTLVRGASGVSPANPAVPMNFGVAGATTIGSTAINGSPMSVGWEAALPEPVLSGDTATYPNVRPGIDLRVEALRTGFEVSFVVKSKPTGALSLPLTLTTKGLSASQTTDGSLAVADSKGVVVSRGATPFMFGAAKDPTTDMPSKSATVGDSLGSAQTRPDGSTVRTWTMTPSASFFNDPSVTYPVTVDPPYTYTINTDTYVSSAAPSTSYYSATHLYIGKSTTTTARTLLHINTIPTAISGMYIDNAYLQMFNSYSGSCAASQGPVYLQRVGSWTSSTTWNNQPSLIDTQSTSYFAHNGPLNDCGAAAYDDMDVTAVAQGWADGTVSTKDFRVASTESTTLGWKEFYSVDAGSGLPALHFTYRAYPTTGAPTISGALGTGPSSYWMKTATPSFTDKITSATGSTVQGRFEVYNGANMVSQHLGNSVPSGGFSNGAVTTGDSLANNTLYTLKVWGVSGGAVSKASSSTLQFKIDTAPPSVTTIGSTDYPANVWTNGISSGTFNLQAQDTNFDHYAYALDSTNLTSNTTAASIVLSPPAGWHTLRVQAVDKAGNLGSVGSYSFGTGTAVTAPVAGAVTAKSLSLAGSTQPCAPPGPCTVSVVYYYRRSANDPWLVVPHAQTTGSGFTSWPFSVDQNATTGVTSTALNWDVKDTPGMLAGPLQVQVCFGASCPVTESTPYSTLPSGSGNLPVDATLDLTSFNTASTESLGPVGLNLLTGNTQLSTTDASVPGGGGSSLSIGRTLNTATVATTPGNAALGVGQYTQTGVFGPGWTADLPVDTSGNDWTGLTDTGSVLTLNSPDQSSVAFTNIANAWVPTGQDSDSGLTLAATACGGNYTSYRCFTLTDTSGVQVIFLATLSGTTPGTVAAPVAFTVMTVHEPGSVSDTSFTRNAVSGLVDQILSPLPYAGADCGDPNDPAHWAVGCRGLNLTYGDGTTGKPLGQLVAATYLTSTTSAPLEVDVACWDYDSNGRLSDSWDPRDIPTASALPHAISCGATPLRATHYSYDSQGRVTQITPDWNGTSSPRIGTALNYDTQNRLVSVVRTHSGGAGSETTTVGYGVNVAPDTNGQYRPDLRSTTVGTWAQLDVPDPATGGTAICPPGSAPSTASGAATNGANVSGDLSDCTLTYQDANGRTVNTASYSGTDLAGWHISTTEYDALGHAVRSLDAADREEALNPPTGPDVLPLSADHPTAALQLSTLSLYGINSGDGTPDLVNTFGPFHAVMIGSSTPGGTAPANARQHTQITYDTGTEPNHPAGGPLHLQMQTVVGASQSPDAVATNEVDDRTTQYLYDLGPGNTLGWKYRTPLETITDPTGLNIIHKVTLDDATGRIVSSQSPQDVAAGVGAGSTAGTSLNIYYSRTAISGGDSDCGLQPLFDGMLCKTYAADLTPTSGLPGLLITKTEYDSFGRVIKTTETPSSDTSHARVSTSVFGFNSAMTCGGSCNPYATSTQQGQVTGGVGTGFTNPTSTTFDATTGEVTSVSDGTTADLSEYDEFGRLWRYTENTSASGNQANVTTTSYDPVSGQVTSTADLHQYVSYAYNGGTEHRGLATAQTIHVTSTAGATLWSGVWAAGYDADGRVITQTDPNGVTSLLTRNEDGQLTARDDSTTGGVWLFDHATPTIFGQWSRHASPAGSQAYAYDAAGRLSTVQDTPAPPTPSALAPCTTRAYTFDQDTNRKSSTVYPASSTDGFSCSTTGGTTVLHNYDAADRLLATGTNDAGIAYDSFGRITNLPGKDTSANNAAKPLLNSLYVTDQVASQSQQHTGDSNYTTDCWTLDPSGRARTATSWTSTTSGTCSGTQAWQHTSHYDDASSDSPSWIAETSDGAGWTANVQDMIGALNATVDQTGAVTYQYANLHGDIQATGINGVLTTNPEYDEFGVPEAGQSSRYGWLGGHERSGEDVGGLLLMGVRVYAPMLGRFLSTDPVPGGSANSYDYTAQDPVNQFDLDGRMITGGDAGNAGTPAIVAAIAASMHHHSHHSHHHHWWHSAMHWVAHHKLDIALTACMFIPGVGEVAAAAEVLEGAEAAVESAEVIERGIYVFRGTSGKLYVGMSNNISRRLAQHVVADAVTAENAARAERVAVSGGRLARRIAEQRRINQEGGIGNLQNKINSIAERHWGKYGILL